VLCLLHVLLWFLFGDRSVLGVFCGVRCCVVCVLCVLDFCGLLVLCAMMLCVGCVLGVFICFLMCYWCAHVSGFLRVCPKCVCV